MTTLIAPTPTSKTTRKPAHGKCHLTLSINGTDYRLKPIPCEDFAEVRAWRLRKADGTTYDLVETLHGRECSCPDFIFARDGIDPAGCKHCKACVALGLLSAPAIGPEPAAGGGPATPAPAPADGPATGPVPCRACAADDRPATPTVDGYTWGIAEGLADGPEGPPDEDGPGPDDADPRLTLAEWLRGEAAGYHALETDAGDMLAELIDALARRVERVGASTRAEYEDRWAAIDAPAR